MKRLKKSWGGVLKNNTEDEHESDWSVYADILQAQANWQEAYMYFEEALGDDQVDYAIYMLEAAERKYQMHLKQAKKLGINRNQLTEKREITG